MKYTIATGQTDNELITNVNSLISHGWAPLWNDSGYTINGTLHDVQRTGIDEAERENDR